MKYQYLVVHSGNDRISDRGAGGVWPRDPSPALSFATPDSADAIILTGEIHAEARGARGGGAGGGGAAGGDTGGGDWLRGCGIQVGYV